MKLKLSDWASVAEIASGIAVVLTLVILILSINKNTAVTQASMFAGLVEDLNNIYYTVVPDPELRRIWSQYIGGNRCRENARSVEMGLGEVIQAVSTQDFSDFVATSCPAE